MERLIRDHYVGLGGLRGNSLSKDELKCGEMMIVMKNIDYDLFYVCRKYMVSFPQVIKIFDINIIVKNA